MSVVSNRQFMLYTLGLLVVWIIVLATAISSSSISISGSNLVLAADVTNDDEKTNIRNCKALCGQCDCLDFYCGEECICECNNENSDTECIARMQANAERVRMPFEILIQGPSANSFVRNALQFEQKNLPKKNWHSKRSTVTIYKPDLNGSMTVKTKLANSLRSNGIGNNLNEKVAAERPKRSATGTENLSNTNQFEWFSDLTNNLVRPAPLGRRNKKTEDLKTTTDLPKADKSHSVMEKPWFMDNIVHILTPAPLSKRQGFSYSRERSNDDDDVTVEPNTDFESSPKTSLSIFPLRSKEGRLHAFSKDIVNAFGVQRMTKKANNDLDNRQLWNKNIDNVLLEVPSIENTYDDLDSKLEETLKELNRQRTMVKTPEPVKDLRNRDSRVNDEEGTEFRIPWWRPVQFFKRVVLNQ